MPDYKRCLILPSTYRDSVELMKLSVALETLSGVHHAAVMMGTPHNKSILRDAGLLTSEGEQADANDLLICVQANTFEVIEHVGQEANKRLARLRVEVKDAAEMAPRTLETALERLPAANRRDDAELGWLESACVGPSYGAAERWAMSHFGFMPNLFRGLSACQDFYPRHQLALALLEAPQSTSIAASLHALVRATVIALNHAAYFEPTAKALLRRRDIGLRWTFLVYRFPMPGAAVFCPVLGRALRHSKNGPGLNALVVIVTEFI